MNNQVTQSKIKQFVEYIQQGIEEWIKAGEIICEILDENPDAIDTICDQIPGISREIIFRFEQIGRKAILPNLLLSNCPGNKKLLQMSYSQQQQYFHEPLPVLICKDNDKYDTLLISVEKLTPEQCRQVFDSKNIRDISAQRAYIESCKRDAVIKGIPTEYMPYTIKKGIVMFRKDTKLNKKEIKHILEVM